MKKKLILKSAVLVIMALFLVLPFAASLRASAFSYKEIDEDNNLIVESQYKNAPGSSGWKYAGGDWYFFFEETGGKTEDLNAAYYENGFVVELINLGNSQEDANGIYTNTSMVDAEDLLDTIIRRKGYGWLHANGGNITLYANRLLYAYKAPNEPKDAHGPYYDYEEFYEAPRTISNWMGYWSGNVLKAVKTCYDAKVYMTLKGVSFTPLTVGVDADGKVVNDKLYDGSYSFGYSKVFYSEPIEIESPGTITDYTYLGWELKAGSEVIASGETSDVSFIPKYDPVQDRALTLTFIYEEVKV